MMNPRAALSRAMTARLARWGDQIAASVATRLSAQSSADSAALNARLDQIEHAVAALDATQSAITAQLAPLAQVPSIEAAALTIEQSQRTALHHLRRTSDQQSRVLERLEHVSPPLEDALAGIERRLSRTVRALSTKTYTMLASLVELRARLDLQIHIPVARSWSLSPDTALLLVRLLEQHKPRAILDLGSGFSTVIFASYAKQSGARVTSLDHDPVYLAGTQESLRDYGLAENVDLILAPLMASDDAAATGYYRAPDDLLGAGPFDFVFVDGPPSVENPTARGGLLPLFAHAIRSGATILLDDFSRTGEQAVVNAWIEAGYVALRHRHDDLDKHAAELEFLGTAATALHGAHPEPAHGQNWQQ